ncbi:DUF3696 domain-containing protein, partial [Candidatus Poribacteria bacterium]|nr:DUF3696 domain-containing protein [Candidatus Poribacteria bacterium]
MKNFKSWKDSGEVELAPLTGFFGTNSSGKSSLLQMLLLLRQNFKRRDFLYFGREYSLVNLGSFREVIHQHKEKALLELEFGCKLLEPFEIRGDKEENSSQIEDGVVSIDNFTFNTFIRAKEEKVIIEQLCYRIKSQVIQEVKWEWQTQSLSCRNSLGIPIETSRSIRNCYGGPGQDANDVLGSLATAFENLFVKVYYLGPIRADPRRHYTWEGNHPAHIGQWGDEAIDALLSACVRKLKTLHEEEEVPIEERISYWLKKMDLAHSFSLDSTRRGVMDYEIRIQKSPGSAAVTLVDMGYGLGQFLPILVLCYYAPEGSTLILEQPGLHLHPKVQSQIADLLIEVVNERKLQILVESHSEHLLNRLQRRVAEEKIRADQTALYFCRNDDGISTIEHLVMDEFGNIANWPENFFGDEMGDLFAMTEAQMERQKRMEDK